MGFEMTSKMRLVSAMIPRRTTWQALCSSFVNRNLSNPSSLHCWMLLQKLRSQQQGQVYCHTLWKLGLKLAPQQVYSESRSRWLR